MTFGSNSIVITLSAVFVAWIVVYPSPVPESSIVPFNFSFVIKSTNSFLCIDVPEIWSNGLFDVGINLYNEFVSCEKNWIGSSSSFFIK